MDARLAAWLTRTHGAPTPAQREAVPLLLDGHHLLVSSPTGSGKTLAAFLAVLTDLARRAPLEDRTYCVYVSPLRALVNDMARSLAAPIEGAQLSIRVAIRTGDTPPAGRQRQRRSPPHVLVTTPESLALLLSSPRAREHLRGLRWVVVDEVHALAGSKRGAQLALTLERLAAFAGEFQRVGLSATVAPLDRVAAFLGGDRPVRTVEVLPEGEPEIEVRMPVADPIGAKDEDVENALLGMVEDAMARCRTTIVFTNTRAQAERMTAKLQERHRGEVEDADVDASHVATHHGSMSKEARLAVEERLKRAQVRCVVASSSLELGIHAEHVERVILLGSPKSAARALQRVGRSGHLPGGTARATLVVTDPADLPEALALQRLVRARRVEEARIPENALDVLQQHLAALRLEDTHATDEAYRLTRRAWPYRELARGAFEDALDALPRVPRMVYLQNAGTIPESGLLKVFHDERYIGEVEEEFAAGLQPDDVFTLAGAAWRYVRATPARVQVAPARGNSPTVPEWRGEGISASPLLAEATLHALLGLSHGSHASDVTESAAVRFVAEQARVAALPEGALAETFPTDSGARALVVHAYLGRRANDALARALAYRHGNARPLASDWGFALFAPRAWKPTRTAILRFLADPIEPTLREALVGSELLKRRFRHVATRGLLLPRREEESLGQRQLAATMLLGRLLRVDPEHPLLREAREECLRDAMDVDAAEAWRRDVLAGRLPLRLLDRRPCASPLAARILAPPGEARREALRDNADRICYHDGLIARR